MRRHKQHTLAIILTAIMILAGTQHTILSAGNITLFADTPINGFYGSGWNGTKLDEATTPTHKKQR